MIDSAGRWRERLDMAVIMRFLLMPFRTITDSGSWYVLACRLTRRMEFPTDQPMNVVLLQAWGQRALNSENRSRLSLLRILHFYMIYYVQ